MYHINIYPEEQHPPRIIDGGDEDLLGDNVIALTPALEDNLLFHIAKFLCPIKAAVVCKLFLKAATETARSVLKSIEDNCHVNSDWQF
jgi:hypothetical protein